MNLDERIEALKVGEEDSGVVFVEMEPVKQLIRDVLEFVKPLGEQGEVIEPYCDLGADHCANGYALAVEARVKELGL